MKRSVAILIVVSACAAPAFADPPGATHRYPRVYGPTGRPYGPSQAEYQYERQYGRPWHGYGGNVSAIGPEGYHYTFRPAFRSPFVGYGWYGNFGFGCVRPSPYYGYPFPGYIGTYYAPPIVVGPGPWYSVNSSVNRALADGPRADEERWGPPPIPRVNADGTPAVIPSSLEAQARSVRKQDHGDMWLRKLDYANAQLNYRGAVEAAPERAEPRFRLGIVLAALGRFPEAVAQLKRGLELDPTWPTTGPSLDELFGEEHAVEKATVQHRVADWVRENMRDPDRHFLMGVLLHFDHHDQAPVFFETALRLAGRGDHLLAFLRPAANEAAAPRRPADRDADDPPPPQPSPFVPPLPEPEEVIPQRQSDAPQAAPPAGFALPQSPASRFPSPASRNAQPQEKPSPSSVPNGTANPEPPAPGSSSAPPADSESGPELLPPGA